MTKVRIERLLLLTIGKYFQKNSLLLVEGTLLSLVEVSVTPNLELARIYISFLGQKNIEASKMLQQILEEHHWPIKKYVATQLRHRLRKIPAELRFYIDERGRKASQITQLLDTLTPS